MHGISLGDSVKRSRTAVLIADSFGSPFSELKAEVQTLIWSPISNVDIYYMRGFRPNKFSEFQNQMSEKMRYSKLWPIQRATDNLLLSKKSINIPTASFANHDIKVEVNEGLRNLGLKSLSAYKALMDFGYEIVYKTTLSSIVQPKLFQEAVENIPSNTPHYTGTVIHFGEKPFISGANLFLNRKAIEILLRKRTYWQHGLLDDVAIGRLLRGYLSDTGLNSINIESLEQVEKLTKKEITRTMHFRCKSSKTPRNDVEIIKLMNSKMSS